MAVINVKLSAKTLFSMDVYPDRDMLVDTLRRNLAGRFSCEERKLKLVYLGRELVDGTFVPCSEGARKPVISVVFDNGDVSSGAGDAAADVDADMPWMAALSSFHIGRDVGDSVDHGDVLLTLEQYSTVTHLSVPPTAYTAAVKTKYATSLAAPGTSAADVSALASRLMFWSRGRRLPDAEPIASARYLHVTCVVMPDDAIGALPRFNCPYCEQAAALEITLLCPKNGCVFFELTDGKAKRLELLTWRQLACDVKGRCCVCDADEMDSVASAGYTPSVALRCNAKQPSGYVCPAASRCPRTPGGGVLLASYVCKETPTRSLEAALCAQVAAMFEYPATGGHRVQPQPRT